MTDFRALCAELLQAMDEIAEYEIVDWGYVKTKPLKMADKSMEEARAALAAEVVREEPTDEEILRFVYKQEPKPIPMTRYARKNETCGVVDGLVTYNYYPESCIKGNLQTTEDGSLRWVFTEYLNQFDGDDRSIEVDATSEILELARYCNSVTTSVKPEGPTDDEWYTLVDRVWDKYETIGYQGERIMHCSDFGNALDIVRKEFTRYGRGKNNV